MEKKPTYSFLSELVRTPAWSMVPAVFNYYRHLLLLNRGNSEIRMEEIPEPPRLLFFDSEHKLIEEKLYTDASKYEKYLYESEKRADDQIINLTPIQGPITHGGAMCAYGTRELADQFMFADAHPKVIGHLVVLDTPGGSTSANDLNEVIANAKKPVVGLIRGMNASKGVHISTFIPHVYAENENVDIGSIGVFASFSGMKNGSVHEGETFYELYAKASTEKNEWYREAIQNGNMEPLQKELDRLESEFAANVKSRWPNVKDERLHGKMFKAGEVVGELVDGIMSYTEAFNKIFELAGIERKEKGFVSPIGIVPGSDDSKTTTSIESSPQNATHTPSATEVTEAEEHTNPQSTSFIMKEEQLKSILGDDVKCTVREDGTVEMTPELWNAVSAAYDKQSNELAQERQAKEAAEKTVTSQLGIITELSQETRPFKTGKATIDNAMEQGKKTVEGSILAGVTTMSARMQKVQAFAEELGLPIKP